MPSPFLGMDPFLEEHEIWSGFHHSLAVKIAAHLNPLIGPKYYADIEIDTVSQEVSIGKPHKVRPDTSVFASKAQPYESSTTVTTATVAIPAAPLQRLAPVSVQLRLGNVRVYETATSALVTAIEILSPFNKRPGDGLGRYRRKRRNLLYSEAHLIELDLLRGGVRPGAELHDLPLTADYVLLVNRADAQRISEIWPVALNEPLPLLPVPLLSPDSDAPLDLGAAIRGVYQDSRYDWRIDYRKSVPPPELRPAMAAYIKELLAA
jgi:hypothetical protein